MTRPDPGTAAGTVRGRRVALLAGLTSAATLGGVVLAVSRPEWLMTPFEGAVGSGGLAPLVYVLLCAVSAPLHLSGMLVALSAATWPLGQALGLSFVGVALGGGLGYLALTRAARTAQRSRVAWPGWLARLAATVNRRRVSVGILARLALGSGLALEAFFVFTGYTRRSYAPLLLLGTALYVVQTVLGVTLLHALLESAPGLAGVLALSPLLLGAAALRRRRAA